MVQIKELSFSYKKGKPLLEGLELELQKNKIYGLFGLNGAGKTTLLNIMAGMIFPDSGECKLNGVETKKRKADTLNDLFVVPEQFELPKISGFTYAELHIPFYPDFDSQLFEEILAVFEVDGSKSLAELSFGQQKKFLITFALATQTSLLILDEPTNGLDIPSKSQFRKVLASADTEQRSIIISTHQVRDLGTMIDHVTVIKDGTIVFNHSISDIQQRIGFKRMDSDSTESFLYAEDTLGGKNALIASSGEFFGEMDLELLFNGIVLETQKIQEVLS